MSLFDGFDSAAFHFAEPVWLWALLVLPAMLFRARRRRAARGGTRYRAFADPELLPHLLVGVERGRTRSWLWLWVPLWLLGVLALAGPRWDYTEVVFRQPERSLVVLLDISRSMDVEDVPPSRLRLARREIEDLVDRRGEVRIGLVVFASIAHTVAPITEDGNALARLLPYLDSSLGQLGGSRPRAALQEARRLLGLDTATPQAPEKGHRPQRDVLLISDGDFGPTDPQLEADVQALARDGVTLHVLGVGTTEGGDVPLIDPQRGDRGLLIGPDRRPVHSALQSTTLQRLALAGGGLYLQADITGAPIPRLLAAIRGRAATQSEGSSQRVWREHFAPLVVLMLLLMAPWWLRARRAS